MSIRPIDKVKKYTFCCQFSTRYLLMRFFLVFSDEATFHLSRKVNGYGVINWGIDQPHNTIQHVKNSAKVNIFCTLQTTKVYGSSIFAELTVTGDTYLDVLGTGLMPQLQENIG
jgi:hypothetical protein